MNIKLEKIIIMSYKWVNVNETGRYNILLRAWTPQIPKVTKSKTASHYHSIKNTRNSRL